MLYLEKVHLIFSTVFVLQLFRQLLKEQGERERKKLGQGLRHDYKDPTNPVLLPNRFNERAEFTFYVSVKGKRAHLLSQLLYLILSI